MSRIHIMGAPGAGVTSVGRTLAQHVNMPFFDVDDFVWFTDDPLPYRRKRNVQHRLQLLTEALKPCQKWVLSGSLCGWGDELIPSFDLVIYLNAAPQIRAERIKARETDRYGAERLAPGGDLHLVFEKFVRWAVDYDTPSANLRSAQAEQQWLAQMVVCPVLTLDSSYTTTEYLVQQILGSL